MSKYQSFQEIMNHQLMIPKQLLTEYRRLGLDEKELAVLLQIHRFYLDGNPFPTPEELAGYLSFSSQDCSKVLRSLIQKQLITIEQKHSEQLVRNESYSLEPLWEKLFAQHKHSYTTEEEQAGSLFSLFEQEFGRPLSPFEIENINIWLDQEEQEPSLIKAALREAVLMGKLNFKYIDRILREWKRKGIQTVDQARQHGKQFRQGQAKNSSSQAKPKRDVSLYYNWLEEDS
ncbi:DnaD domain-containing protein [Halobacillus shinanisalinarum]|uniref:DnaD domain-containing protein n=1 Tax=Halobacillus shinanisalinarum TaxID=2932258 RepID=A0ABY4GZP9_9BACI|nr:DnaD domain-containing protein [Halobacillus shinanisalinarum]UOQ93549.1 DnaD domain-containing protein [Halobacillus shinanisalinarum]